MAKKKKSLLYKPGYLIPNVVSLLLGIFMLNIKYMDLEGYILMMFLLIPPIVFIFTWFNKKIEDKKKRKISIFITVIEIIVVAGWFVWLMWPAIANPICSQWDDPSCWSTENGNK